MTQSSEQTNINEKPPIQGWGEQYSEEVITKPTGIRDLLNNFASAKGSTSSMDVELSISYIGIRDFGNGEQFPTILGELHYTPSRQGWPKTPRTWIEEDEKSIYIYDAETRQKHLPLLKDSPITVNRRTRSVGKSRIAGEGELVEVTYRITQESMTYEITRRFMIKND